MEKEQETLQNYINETQFEIKPSLWERVKQSKFIQTIKRITKRNVKPYKNLFKSI